jgi:hypothetical protein
MRVRILRDKCRIEIKINSENLKGIYHAEDLNVDGSRSCNYNGEYEYG